MPILALLALTLTACESGSTAQGGTSSTSAAVAPTTLAVTVDGDGYHPARVEAPAGKAVRLVFTRTSDEGCGQQLVFPELKLRRDLPLNAPVNVDLTMPSSGAVSFTCGMNMLQGSVVAH